MKALSVEQIALSFFVSAAVLLALLSGMVWYASIQTEAATRSVTQSHIVLYSLEKILSATSRAESAQRSYYLSRNAIFINRRDAALREISENAKTVSELAVDNPLHTLQQEQALAPILERRIELFHHNQALFDALGKVGAYLDFEKVTADTEKIYSAILRMQEEQSSLLLQREAAELERLATGRFYFAGLSALMMLMFGLSSWLMKRAYDKQRVARSAEAEVRQQNVGLERTVFQQTDELSKTSENLHLLVEGIKDYALIMLDPEGRVLTWNSGAQRLKGYRAEEIIGQHFSIFHPPEDVQQDKAERMLQQTKQVGHYSIEGWRVRKDGSRFLASVNLTALRDEQGRLRGFAKVTRDITKFKQNEVLLNSEKNVLEIMSAGAPLADILESIARNVERCTSDALCSVLLLDADGVHMHYGAALSLPPEYNRAIEGAPIGPQAGSCGTAVYRNEQVIVSDIATDPLWVEYAPLALQHGLRACWSTPVCSMAGQVLGTFALFYRQPRAPGAAEFDLIERWTHLIGIAIERGRANEEIHALNVDLERRIKIRTADLEVARQQALEANRLKSEFLANMSHELRTPLNAIIGFSDALKEGLVGELASDQREYIGDIYNSGRHLLELINDILDLSKVEAGKMTLDLEPLELASTLHNSLAIVKEKATAHRIRLTQEVDADLGAIQADVRKLKQMLYNLLSNAVKFSPEGGEITLHAHRVTRDQVGKIDRLWPSRIFPLQANSYKEFIEFGVCDAGLGISAEDLALLFQPFTQIDGGLSRQHEGTGLGLVMVKNLAELHGGTIAVASEVGTGSCFYIWLPLLRDEAEVFDTPLAVHEPHDVHATEQTALVIEDNDRAAELLRIQLESEGFKVLRARSAEEALACAPQQPLALITLDILLNGMDGWELLARIKKMPELAHVPVVILSIVADSNKGFALGASAVLQKPISRDELHEVLYDVGLDKKIPDVIPTVLVVDDDPKMVEMIAAHMSSDDYTVVRAYGGREAIELAQRQRPDLILLDLMMPEVNGFDVVEMLKGDAATAAIPIVIVTAKTITAEDRVLLNGFVTQIVNKSEIAQGNFIQEVRRTLMQHRMRR